MVAIKGMYFLEDFVIAFHWKSGSGNGVLEIFYFNVISRFSEIVITDTYFLRIYIKLLKEVERKLRIHEI